MENGWVKLHRKIINNDIFHDENALKMFLWILISVDKSSGTKNVARSWCAPGLRMKPTTFYDVLKRLEKKYKVVTARVTSKYTVISLINWKKYQVSDSSGDINPTSTRHQPDINPTLYKNREYKNKESILYKYDIPKKENFPDEHQETNSKPPTSHSKLERLPREKLWAISVKENVHPDEVRRVQEDVFYSIENGDKYKVKDVNLTVQRWVDLELKRKNIERLTEEGALMVKLMFSPES